MTNLFCPELNRVFVALKERDITAMDAGNFYYVSGQKLYQVSRGDENHCHAREVNLSIWIADRKAPSLAQKLKAQIEASQHSIKLSVGQPFHVLAIDELGHEFSATVIAETSDHAADAFAERYPENRGILRIESKRQQKERERKEYFSVL